MREVVHMRLSGEFSLSEIAEVLGKIGETDDSPGAALIGIVLMIGLVILGVRAVWRRR